MPKRRSDSLTWLMWVFLAIFILCIIPILSAGHYAHPLYAKSLRKLTSSASVQTTLHR